MSGYEYFKSGLWPQEYVSASHLTGHQPPIKLAIFMPIFKNIYFSGQDCPTVDNTLQPPSLSCHHCCCGTSFGHVDRVTRSSRFVILYLTFAAKGRHSSLWPEATTFERSHRDYLRPEAATVRYGLRPQHLKNHLTGTI